MRRSLAALLAAPLAVSMVAVPMVVAGGSVPAQRHQAATRSPITIGLVTSLTGPLSTLGTGNVQGVGIAVNQVNASGGIHGHKVVVVTKDDQSDASQAPVAMNGEVSAHALAVIGPVNSSSAPPMDPIAQQNKIPLVEITASQQTVVPAQPYVYDVVPTGTQWSLRILQYFKAVGIKRVAFAYDQTGLFGVNAYHAMQKSAHSFGVTVADYEAFGVTSTDFSSILAHVRAAHVQALYAVGAGPAEVILTKQFAASGLAKTVKLVFTGAEASSLYTKPAGSAADGVLMDANDADLGPRLPSSKFKAVAEALIKPYEAKYHTAPPQFAVDAYAAAQLLFAAMRKAHTLTGPAIEAQLEHLNMLTVDGAMNFSPKVHGPSNPNNLALVVVKKGAFLPTPWETKVAFASLPR